MPTVYEIVTSEIVKQLESGCVPWRKPWRTEPAVNLISQKPYRGINTFLLGSQGKPSRYWLSLSQAAKLGGTVKPGERSSLVVFWNVGKEKLNPKTGKVSKPFLLRYYRVVNLSQTEGIAHKLGLAEIAAQPVEDLPLCERIVAEMPGKPGIDIGHTNQASYSPRVDRVNMPAKALFHTSAEFYSTMFHELTHSTGHASRLSRDGITDVAKFGSETYSKEELIAEMGAAMLCSVTGIAPATIENSAAYLRSWISVLKGDSKLLVTAASAAQKAADYIRGVRAAETSDESQSEAN
jgi:antirestriction protein ArdC